MGSLWLMDSLMYARAFSSGIVGTVLSSRKIGRHVGYAKIVTDPQDRLGGR